jgi:hypothetical protein
MSSRHDVREAVRPEIPDGLFVLRVRMNDQIGRAPRPLFPGSDTELKESIMRKQARLMAVIAALLLLTACGQPVPQDKAAYVGQWSGQAMSLLLTQEGRVVYKRVKSGGTTSIDAPLQKFVGDNFVVGLPYISTTFEVSKPPYQEAGTWKMVVDGVELTRAP